MCKPLYRILPNGSCLLVSGCLHQPRLSSWQRSCALPLMVEEVVLRSAARPSRVFARSGQLVAIQGRGHADGSRTQQHSNGYGRTTPMTCNCMNGRRGACIVASPKLEAHRRRCCLRLGLRMPLRRGFHSAAIPRSWRPLQASHLAKRARVAWYSTSLARPLSISCPHDRLSLSPLPKPGSKPKNRGRPTIPKSQIT